MEQLLLVNEYKTEPQELTIPNGKLVLFSNSYPGYSDFNGDSLGILQINSQKSVLLLADGAGGTPGGNQASGICLEIIMKSIKSLYEKKRPIRDGVLDGIERANAELLEKKTGACTTICVLEIENQDIRPYHVGDSSIMVVGQRGKRKLKTISHSPHGYAVESGLLDESDIPEKTHQILVSNLLGTRDMRIEMGQNYKCLKKDTVLMASDGVTDNISLEDTTEIIRRGSLLSSGKKLAAQTLKNMEEPPANINPKPDDYSFILFRPI